MAKEPIRQGVRVKGPEGVFTDDRIGLGDKGGRTSKIEGRFDLLPSRAMTRLAAVFEEGAEKYSPNNWRLLPLYDHVNHALAHIEGADGFLSSGRLEELAHAACRIMMALEMASEYPHPHGCPCHPCNDENEEKGRKCDA